MWWVCGRHSRLRSAQNPGTLERVELGMWLVCEMRDGWIVGDVVQIFHV